ncbi:MAG: hypothetical protein IPM54_29575 [Polyangiaceae bacterium]|nr:hypothetical protein [Polyangiaceae bacterium]
MTRRANDPIDTVRKARHEISREHGHDPERLVAHYLELQARFKGRIIPGPESDEELEMPFNAASSMKSVP